MAVDTGTFGVQALSDPVSGAPIRAGSLSARSITIAGGVALGVLTGVAFAFVLIAAQHSTFLTPPALPRYYPTWMAGPLHGIWSAAPTDRVRLMHLSSWAMAAMYISYVVVLLCLVRVRSRWILATIVAVHVVFFLSPPLAYTDVFNYLNYGRMGIVHHLNPYTSIPALEPHSDPTFAISNWHHLASPYGPLFTLLTYALVPLGVPVSFWVLKLALALASLGTLALLYRTAELLGRDGIRAVAFVGLNPLVLVWGLGADHNDFLMVFFVMLAVYLVVAARQAPAEGRGPSLADVRAGHETLARWAGAYELGAGAAIVTAVAIKASAAIMLPFLLIGALRRRGLLIGGAIAAAAVGLTSLLAFGAHLPDLGTQGRLVTAIGLPNLLGLALGQGGETDTLRAIVTGVLALTVVGGLLWARGHRRDWIAPATVAVLVLIMTLSWTAPWYVLWLLPLAALWRSAHLRTATLVLGVYFLLTFVASTGELFKAIHFSPSATALGRQHTRDIDQVLR
jgi:hypothetical protein